MLKNVKLTTKTGHSWITNVNGKLSNDEITAYFMGVEFNDGDGVVVKVEFLFIANFKGVLKDSIGLIQNFKGISTYGENEEIAKINLYNDYDHIRNIDINQYLGR